MSIKPELDRLPCQGRPIEDMELVSWCPDCPLGSVARKAIRAEADKQLVMTSEAGIEREVERTNCSGKQTKTQESECGSSFINVCDNPFLKMLVAEWQASPQEPVQNDSHLLE